MLPRDGVAPDEAGHDLSGCLPRGRGPHAGHLRAGLPPGCGQGPHPRRPQRPPAGAGSGRRRDLPGLGRGAPPAPHPPRDLPGGRRPGGADPRRRAHLPPGRQRGAAPGPHHPLRPRRRGKGRLQALHAEGDLRAAPGPLQHPAEPAAPGWGNDPPGSALQRPGAGGPQPHPHRGLRHQLALGARGQVSHRAAEPRRPSKSTTPASTATANP